MLHPHDKPTSSIVLHQHRAAQMAPPVLLTSMPKCQISQKSGHKLRKTTMRCEQEQPLAHHLRQPNTTSNSRSSSCLVQNSHTSTRQVHQSRLEQDQVLLIVQDDHMKGGGVPVIGRRLPSKSQNGYLASVQEPELNEQLRRSSYDERHVEYAHPMQTYNAEKQVAPVVGRRSHRIQQQHQQPIRVQQYDNYTAHHILREQADAREHSSALKQLLSAVENHNMKPRMQTVELRQTQPQNIKSNRSSSRDNQRPTHQLLTGYHDLEKKCYLPGRSSHDYQLPVEQQQRYASSSSRSRSQAEDIQFVHSYRAPPPSKLATAAVLHHSSSYSSLCSTSNEEFYPCCSPILVRNSTRCREICCRPINNFGPPTRSASCQRIPVCCSEVITSAQSNEGKKNRKKDQQNLYQYEKYYVQELQIPKSSSSISSSSTSTSTSNTRYHRTIANDSHHHSSCRANHGEQTGNHHNRASSCHDPSRRRQQAQEAPLLISGRNLLPVSPSKVSSAFPQLTPQTKKYVNRVTSSSSSSSTRTNVKSPAEQDTEPMKAAVTQMYESLAAELKAKLGDPKMGPILLPPKDYDTISRKQGKLTGIELRRSTNPQLVGPSSSVPRSSCQQVINEDQALVTPSPCCPQTKSSERGLLHLSTQLNRQQGLSSVEKCDSARSSARSQEDRSLRRSRSNSSSGLGSISVGERSPSSSKSSSNEDMRDSVLDHQRRQTKQKVETNHHHFTDAPNGFKSNSSGNSLSVTIHRDTTNTARSSIENRKNCSPDNCGSSDSGHSEGSPLDCSGSSSSSEEQAKLLMAETGGDVRMCNYNEQQIKNCQDYSAKDHMSHQQYESTRMNRDRSRAGMENHNPSKVSEGILWNGRVEVPLKVNSNKNGNTYLATKQIIY